MGQRILVVGGNRALPSQIRKKLDGQQQWRVEAAPHFHDLKRKLCHGDSPVFAVILDYKPADPSHLEALKFLNTTGLPCLILTSVLDESIQRAMSSDQFVEYYLKDEGSEVDLAAQTLLHLSAGSESKILLVDGDDQSRAELVNLLRGYNYQVVEESKGADALRTCMKDSEIKMIITDMNLPDIPGTELVRKLRTRASKDSLAILGLCSNHSAHERALFLKLGANDFLKRPFDREVFFSRVSQNLEIVDLFLKIKDISNTDHLTRLFNRRYLFNNGSRYYSRSKRARTPMAVAMIDVDHFKRVNDRFGHLIGDRALQRIADVLNGSFRPTDLVSRYGGEEFCVLMLAIRPEDAYRKLERVRRVIEDVLFESHDGPFRLTISVGLAFDFGPSLHDMVRRADELLYRAKTMGRNRVVSEKMARDAFSVLLSEGGLPRTMLAGSPTRTALREPSVVRGE